MQTRPSDEDESTTTETEHGAAAETGSECCHETVDAATRASMLAEYKYRCQTCGRTSPANGGLATLHVHHLTREPDEIDEHDPANLTVLCRMCHHWHHQQVTEADLPVTITEADLCELLPRDLEILRILAETGPATTGEVTAELTTDPTVMTVRERLWVLMGLDNRVADRERQLVDQDVETGRWGLVGQIHNSARGHIADDPQTLLQRMEDERVRQALERGCDRATIADVLDVTGRTTFHMQKRAYAYDFPLEALDSRGGRPPTGPDERQPTAGAGGNAGPTGSNGARQ